MTYIPGSNPFSIVEKTAYKTPMFFVTAMVCGDQARDMLMHNREPEKGKEATNRKASDALINKYSLLMLSDQWEENPQPIVLSEADDGEFEVSDLNDGQQRLKAVVKASLVRPDIEVPLTFAFNAPRGSKWVIDQGKKRLPKDFLDMAGIENAAPLSHAIRALWAIENMQPFQSIGLWRRVELAPQVYGEFLKSHTELVQGLSVARDISVGKKALIMPYVGAVLWYLVSKEYGPFVAQNFFTGLVSGADLPATDPRLAVREFLSVKKHAEKYKWDGFEQLAVLIATVNAWLMGAEGFKAGTAFRKTATKFPQLIERSKMPKSVLTPGNTDKAPARKK